MKRELRDKWIEALRSDRFDQTSGTLERDGAYCCLGVLCVVAEEIGFAKAARGHCNDPNRLKGAYLKAQPVNDQVGDFDDKLVALNDDQRLSFPQIATWIEKHIPAED